MTTEKKQQKWCRPKMTIEARDVLNKMTEQYQDRSLGVISISNKITGMSTLIENEEKCKKFWKRGFDEASASRDYWLRACGVSVLVNLVFLVYTATSGGWFA